MRPVGHTRTQDDSETSRHYACTAPHSRQPPAAPADPRGQPGDEPQTARKTGGFERELLDRYYRNGYTNITVAVIHMKKTPTPLTPAVFHILLALADGPLHGYGIMQAVESSAAGEPPMGPGTIYGSLQRMEEAALVRELAARTDDRRRVFTLLPAGRRALSQEAERLVRLTALVREKRLLQDEA